MIKGIYQAARNLTAGNLKLGAIANNLANLNTTGYKREIPFSQVLDSEGNLNLIQSYDHKQGELTPTDNPLNVAISGVGYFSFETENGQQISRDGKFTLSNEGFLVNHKGDKVLGKSGPISFGENIFENNQSINISKSGEIKVGDEVIDELKIVKVENPTDLKKTSGASFNIHGIVLLSAELEDFRLNQGYIENSNVNPMEEMEAMILLSNNHRSAQKVIVILDESLAQANQIGKI